MAAPNFLRYLRSTLYILAAHLLSFPFDLALGFLQQQTAEPWLLLPALFLNIIIKLIVIAVVLLKFLAWNRGEAGLALPRVKALPVFISVFTFLILLISLPVLVGTFYFTEKEKLSLLLWSLAILYLSYAGLFGYPLILDRNMGPLSALRASFQFTHIQKPAQTILFSVGALLAMIAGGLLFVVGYFLITPAIVFVYCKIFDDNFVKTKIPETTEPPPVALETPA